jgi:hypothetical protein
VDAAGRRCADVVLTVLATRLRVAGTRLSVSRRQAADIRRLAHFCRGRAVVAGGGLADEDVSAAEFLGPNSRRFVDRIEALMEVR